jgi:hypothetical protein
LRELRDHVDSLARLERDGLDSDELNREQTEIRRLRARIATLVRTGQGNRDAAAEKNACQTSRGEAAVWPGETRPDS